MRVYIAGNIGRGLKEDVARGFAALQDKLEMLGIEVLSPIRGKKITDCESFRYEPNEIVHRDEHDIDRADLLIARLDGDKVSFGTPMEIYRAREMRGIPVIVVTESDFVANHYWIKSKATKIVKTMDEATNYIREWYL